MDVQLVAEMTDLIRAFHTLNGPQSVEERLNLRLERRPTVR